MDNINVGCANVARTLSKEPFLYFKITNLAEEQPGARNAGGVLLGAARMVSKPMVYTGQ